MFGKLCFAKFTIRTTENCLYKLMNVMLFLTALRYIFTSAIYMYTQ